MKPLVIKVGGSLLSSNKGNEESARSDANKGSTGPSRHLPEVMSSIHRAAAQRPVVVVPGGGTFSQAVQNIFKSTTLSEQAAHSMALLAMAQYGLLLNDIYPAPQPLVAAKLCWGAGAVMEHLLQTRLGVLSGGAAIWLPNYQSDALELPSTWEVTADSLALWLAQTIGAASLLLVKMAPACMVSSNVASDLQTLAGNGIIDAYFPKYTEHASPITIEFCHAEEGVRLEKLLVCR